MDQTDPDTMNKLVIQKSFDYTWTAQVFGYATNNDINATLNVSVKVEGPCKNYPASMPAGHKFDSLRYFVGA